MDCMTSCNAILYAFVMYTCTISRFGVHCIQYMYYNSDTLYLYM